MVMTGYTIVQMAPISTVKDRLRRELFVARQRVHHATSRYQDAKIELMEKMKNTEGGPGGDF
jgi:MamL-1 domain.